MKILIKLILCFLITLNLILKVNGIKCWNCQSNNDPKCADPFDNSTVPISDCDQEKGLVHLPGLMPSMCRKIRQKVNGEMVISRGCTWKTSDDYSSYCPTSSNGPNEVTSFCETCEYDGCNGAATIGKAITLLAAPLALLLFK